MILLAPELRVCTLVLLSLVFTILFISNSVQNAAYNTGTNAVGYYIYNVEYYLMYAFVA